MFQIVKTDVPPDNSPLLAIVSLIFQPLGSLGPPANRTQG